MPPPAAAATSSPRWPKWPWARWTRWRPRRAAGPGRPAGTPRRLGARTAGRAGGRAPLWQEEAAGSTRELRAWLEPARPTIAMRPSDVRARPARWPGLFRPRAARFVYHTCEILAGQLLPERPFTVTGRTGAWHRERGEAAALAWLRQRGAYGFTEWDAPAAVEEIVAALAVLIDLADSPRPCASWRRCCWTRCCLAWRSIPSRAPTARRAAAPTRPACSAPAWSPPPASQRLLWARGNFNEHLLGSRLPGAVPQLRAARRHRPGRHRAGGRLLGPRAPCAAGDARRLTATSARRAAPGAGRSRQLVYKTQGLHVGLRAGLCARQPGPGRAHLAGHARPRRGGVCQPPGQHQHSTTPTAPTSGPAMACCRASPSGATCSWRCTACPPTTGWAIPTPTSPPPPSTNTSSTASGPLPARAPPTWRCGRTTAWSL